jgi:hypothetical protein
VIALDAASSERDDERAGCFHYSTKPVQVDDLRAALELCSTKRT